MHPDGFVVNWVYVVSISDVMEVVSQLCSPAVPSCDSRPLPSISGSGSLVLSSSFVPNDSFLVSMCIECLFSWICSDPDDMGLFLLFFMVVMGKSNQLRALEFSVVHLFLLSFVCFFLLFFYFHSFQICLDFGLATANFVDLLSSLPILMFRVNFSVNLFALFSGSISLNF